MRLPKGLILAGALGAAQAVAGGGLTAAAATTDPTTTIPMTVVTSTGEPVVGVILTAIDETQPSAPPRGCGSDEITSTDTAGHCTFYNMTAGHLYGIWLQGTNLTGSGDARPPAGFQPIILKVTGRQVTPPAAHAGTGSTIGGRVLTSSGEYIPGIGVCAVAGSFNAGVTCVRADAQGNYSVRGCCDVRVMGYLSDQGGPYVNGSVRHAATGVPATIVVQVGAVTTAPTATAAPTARPATGTLAQTGSGLALALVLLACVVMLGAGLTFARSHYE
jgi:hypothetical protein